MQFRLAVVAAILLAGCEPLSKGGGPAFPEADTCGAAAVRSYLGQRAEALAEVDFAQPVRIIPFGAAVTEDFSATRIDFDLDPSGVVVRIWCG